MSESGLLSDEEVKARAQRLYVSRRNAQAIRHHVLQLEAEELASSTVVLDCLAQFFDCFSELIDSCAQLIDCSRNHPFITHCSTSSHSEDTDGKGCDE